MAAARGNGSGARADIRVSGEDAHGHQPLQRPLPPDPALQVTWAHDTCLRSHKIDLTAADIAGNVEITYAPEQHLALNMRRISAQVSSGSAEFFRLMGIWMYITGETAELMMADIPAYVSLIIIWSCC